ncbi:unnamed protein product [Callosobruchus maculatus]|uniref:THAP-type domain-containing protein n=1 Tax=Callosobruchus maculatus TaxID=64391 RepID=A0A653D6E5_CALMS|nr:unnamed protein product [Callosobruchus maculatus]
MVLIAFAIKINTKWKNALFVGEYNLQRIIFPFIDLECFRGDIEKAKLCWKIVEIIKANNRKRLHTLHQTNRRLRSRLHKWTNVWKQLENQNIEERRLKNVWIATLDLSKEQVKNLTIESVICSKHFKDSDFFETP